MNLDAPRRDLGSMMVEDDPRIVQKSRDAAPNGLLNPGKMSAWDNPGHALNHKGKWAFQGLKQANAA